jgi:hypothetical protein
VKIGAGIIISHFKLDKGFNINRVKTAEVKKSDEGVGDFFLDGPPDKGFKSIGEFGGEVIIQGMDKGGGSRIIGGKMNPFPIGFECFG